ncbi:hypothetical protein [Streptomonospora sp. PA3]|uniref:hypothetical protein n=1 Tax=Streptomonospora sp. PA3 TaxID=2607326 RepID=UPI001CA3A5CA|nr:hypothetical protein [Streptomonospora sp. PA3]
MPRSEETGRSRPAADAAFVNLGRSGMGRSLAGTAVLILMTCCAALGAAWPERFLTGGAAGPERTIALVIAIACGLLSLPAIAGVAASSRTHGLAADRTGLWFVTRRSAERVDWPQIRAVGGSWRESRRTFKAGLGARLGQELMRFLTTENGKHMYAVEVFLHDPGSVSGQEPFATHQRLTRDEPPPVPGLPGSRLRFSVRGIKDYREMAAHLHRCAPHLWIGEYRRHSPL